ncbi:MAG TPA: class I SAM-dependent methyltransferase [Acidobacteriota bacterium]|nr:class I SAM-dependent methyltransferase [Acidobacteriota bacterium]
MEHLVGELGPEGRVLDLGAGGGSFNYAATRARVLALDLDFPAGPAPGNARRLKAGAQGLPLKDAAIDVVVCNHTLEHFEDLDSVLDEIGRVLKPGGLLWAAVPDGYSLDDRLYRCVFKGGGHLNQFRFGEFVDRVQQGAQVAARSSKGLNTGFVYLNPPDPSKLPHFPRRARLLGRIRPSWLRAGLVLLNYLARAMDKAGWKGLSRYGWGVVFQRLEEADPPPPPPRLDGEHLSTKPQEWNVCCRCGAGHPEDSLRPGLQRVFLWIKSYRCPLCGQRNLYSRPG